MKKLISLMLAVLFILSLAACGDSAKNSETPKLFVCEELRITLNMDFVDAQSDSYDALFHSDGADILVMREGKDGFDDDMTFERYAELIKNANQNYDIDKLEHSGDLSYYEYTYTVEGDENVYKCMTAVMESKEAFWLVQFYCLDSDYDSYKDSFIAWAGTITFADKK